jgi:hypothetical protein
MKKIYTLLLALSFAGSLRAEDWKLIWVTSDYAWHTHQAQGSLTRTGARLKGTLLDIDVASKKSSLSISTNMWGCSENLSASPNQAIKPTAPL